MENRKRLLELLQQHYEQGEEDELGGSENGTESTMEPLIMEDISENEQEETVLFPDVQIIWEGLGLKISIKKIRHRRHYKLHVEDHLYEMKIDPVSEDEAPTLDIIFAANCGFRGSINNVLNQMKEHYTDPHERIVFLTAIMIGLLNGKNIIKASHNFVIL